MYIPDRVIERRVKEYDPSLYLTWNERGEYFELWRLNRQGLYNRRQLITPVTLSIYDPKAPRRFAPLDERLIWWVWAADSWRPGEGGPGRQGAVRDRRVKEFENQIAMKSFERHRDMAKDIYSAISNFYATKYASKNNPLTTFRNKKPNRWIRPDVRNTFMPRVFHRSGANALRYNFKKPI